MLLLSGAPYVSRWEPRFNYAALIHSLEVNRGGLRMSSLFG
jgi:hypothetical protein